MELEYPNRIYPISDIKRRFWTPRLWEDRPHSNTLRGRMCVPIFSGKGVPLRRLSREDFSRKPGIFFFNNGYQLPRSRGVYFQQVKGFRWWGMSSCPPDSTEVEAEVGGGGGGEKWHKLRQQLWFFWQARLSTDSVFSLIAVFWCGFAIFDFRPCHCVMNVFSHAWISRSSLAIILIEEEFLFHMTYDTIYWVSIWYNYRWISVHFLFLLSVYLNNIISPLASGADPGISFGRGGGGGAKQIMCLHEHYERGTELTFGRGPGPA